MQVAIPRFCLVEWVKQKSSDGFFDTVKGRTTVFLFSSPDNAQEFANQINARQHAEGIEGHWAIGKYEDEDQDFRDDLQSWSLEGYAVAIDGKPTIGESPIIVDPSLILSALDQGKETIEIFDS